MNRLEYERKNAVKINLVETNEFIADLYAKKELKIESKYPTINTINCVLVKGEKCFEYSSDAILPEGPPVKYQDKSYGYQEPFNLINNGFRLNAYKGASLINLEMGKGFESTGEIWELKSEFFKKESIQRAIIPFPKFHKKYMEFIKTSAFNIGESLRFAGYFEITIQNKRFGIYDYEINDIDSIIIDCYDNIESVKFENFVTSIIYCFALISGSLIRDEIIILQFEESNFKKVIGFHYKKIENSLTGIPAINPELYKDLSESKMPSPYLTSILFENLVNQSLIDLRLFRAIKIMTESSDYPLEIKASTYSVALETIKNIIIEDNQEKINPFKAKKIASNTIKILKNEIEKIDDSEFNSKKSVLNKIEQLNQVGNKDSLILSFRLLNLSLTEDDKRCINMRNDFLHGRIPYNSESDDEDYELQHIVYKLHLLVTSLIMKNTGYIGLMLNNIKLVDLLYFKKNIREPLFRKI
jgi:hypothetical protein